MEAPQNKFDVCFWVQAGAKAGWYRMVKKQKSARDPRIFDLYFFLHSMSQSQG